MKSKSNITVKLRGGISKSTVPGSSTPAPYFFYIIVCRIKTSRVKIRPALKKSYLFHELAQLEITCSKLTIETLEKGVNYVQS